MVVDCFLWVTICQSTCSSFCCAQHTVQSFIYGRFDIFS